jgi:hypothetical protein
MTTPPQPPVVIREKKGMGCFGIGCVVLLVALLLFGGLIAGIGYLAYSKAGSLTSAAPLTTRSFDGGDEMYGGAQQKLAVFHQALQQNQPATLELSADEINTLIARDPDMTGSQIHAFVAMTGDQMDLEASIPTSLLPFGLFQGRYLNGEASLSPAFDPASKSLTFTLHALKIGSEAVPAAQLPALQTELQPFINTQMQRYPDAKNFLDHAQYIEVRDSKLLLRTQ